ncbi:MAG: hypothetical protein ACYSUY_11775 [Planctomycetota bacterium]
MPTVWYAVRFPQLADAAGPIVLENVKEVKSRDVDMVIPEPANRK